jgi:hypothetical protein
MVDALESGEGRHDMAVAKKCEHCGNVDKRVTWPTAQDASKDPMFATFSCPNCAWTEFDLVEVEAQPQPTST